MNIPSSKKSFCFDLDDTICIPNHNATDTIEKYAKAKPNQDIIDCIQTLKADGYYIVIHSARRMLTHKGDLKKIADDVGEITKEWLDRHNVPYDELIFGKPYVTEYYVDDKAMNLNDFTNWMNTSYE